MRKPTKYTLELDDCMPELDDTAFLFFHTSVPNYIFVDDLNRLFHLRLERKADLELNGHQWPFFHYYDSITKLGYTVLERPVGSSGSASHWEERGKLMIVKGEVAAMRVEAIRDTFDSPPSPDPYASPQNDERNRILISYQQELTATNLYFPGDPANTTTLRKTNKDRVELDTLVYDLLDCLDRLGA